MKNPNTQTDEALLELSIIPKILRCIGKTAISFFSIRQLASHGDNFAHALDPPIESVTDWPGVEAE